jgi:hypothetical protein
MGRIDTLKKVLREVLKEVAKRMSLVRRASLQLALAVEEAFERKIGKAALSVCPEDVSLLLNS